MRNSIKYTISAVTLLSIVGLYFANTGKPVNILATQKPSTPKPIRGIVGKKAPELNIKSWIDKDGKPAQIKLAHYKGKVIYLLCFQSWCPGCHKYGFPTLKKLSDAFKDNENIVFLAVQTVFEGSWTNTEDKVRKTQLKYGLKISIGHDPGSSSTGNRSSVMGSYRTGGTPWVIIIDKNGTVVFNDFHVDPEKAVIGLKRLVNS